MDIVAEDGEQWIKVSTVTEKRLLFELAKQGWEAASSSSASESEETEVPTRNGTYHKLTNVRNGTLNGNPKDDDDDDKIELIRMAQDLQKASQATRVRYKHPHIHFVLPNIISGRIAEIDHILSTIQSTGATIACGPSTHLSQKPLSEIFPLLLPSATRQLTPTVNVDCTILLALVSDLSHYSSDTIPLQAASGAKDGQPHPASVRQLKMEREEQLLPSVLYPLLQGKKMVCTAEAARRMREIVDTIGTDDEKARTEIFMSDSSSTSSSAELHSRLKLLTHHPIPGGLRLPIRVVSVQIDFSRLRPIAEKVAAQLSEINKSVFLFGWQEGYTTISSNRAVAKSVEAVFEEEDSEEVGPDVWLVGTARSLVGKEKGRG